MIDITRQIGAVNRSVGSVEDKKTVTIAQVYNTDADDLWDAVTNTDRLPRWFLPVSGELREGGHYKIEGNAEGTITKCDPPRSFSATWEFAGAVSWITVQITPAQKGARLELQHTMREDDHWRQFGPAATGVGWDMAMLGLTLYLDGGSDTDPRAVEQWLASAEGVAFMTRSGEEWGAAHIAAGADDAEATAAAKRTILFYTAQPE